MMNISWIDMITNNEQILSYICERRTLWKSWMKRWNEWVGHVIRRDNLPKLIIETKNHLRRPRMNYKKLIIKDQRCNAYWKLKRIADDRYERKKAAPTSLRRIDYKKSNGHSRVAILFFTDRGYTFFRGISDHAALSIEIINSKPFNDGVRCEGEKTQNWILN